jgi:type IV pilus biogenesis protein CpaD/CtpE
MKRQLLLLAMGFLLVGCATNRDNIETRTAYDYTPRWVVYFIHPVGKFLDLTLAKPITAIACSVPDATGCTPNDAEGIRKY